MAWLSYSRLKDNAAPRMAGTDTSLPQTFLITIICCKRSAGGAIRVVMLNEDNFFKYSFSASVQTETF